MGKQKKILKSILTMFEHLETLNSNQSSGKIYSKVMIKSYFEKSLNKKDLIMRILFDALISDDDVLKLLRIIFDNKKESDL
jgi:hypothetical protein